MCGSRRAISGGITTAVRDGYDLLSVSHFYGLFEAYYQKIFVVFVKNGVPPEKPNRPKRFGALKAVKDFRDSLSHPVDEDVSIEEAVGVLSDARQILLAQGLKAKADQIGPQITSLSKRSTWNSENVICVLPTQRCFGPAGGIWINLLRHGLVHFKDGTMQGVTLSQLQSWAAHSCHRIQPAY